ncbi:MAG: 50S ribosomal protein L6 [Christensenellales bacterium]|jgi:large subunit ribosomal protein L6
MSRIGKLPITLPAGVEIKVDDTNTVLVKGPKGELTQKIHKDITLEQENGVLTVNRPSDNKHHRALHGLSRSLINNMVEGVTNGFSKSLDIVGVGYRAQKQGSKLVLAMGYSHPVEIEPPAGINIDVPAPNKIIISGINKQVVGAVAADIRKVRKPEPYKGKGIRYTGEYVRQKEGKTGK